MRACAAAGLLLFTACRSEEPRKLPEATSEAPAGVEGRWVSVVVPQDASLLEAPAIVRADPEASGEVSASARARVEKVHVRVGSRVERGAAIVDVVAPDVLRAAATYVGSSDRLAFHRERAAELERLRAEGLVDKARVFEQSMLAAELEATRNEALATLRGAGVDVANARSLTKGGVLTLRAPVAGVLVELNALPGETLDPGGAPLARIFGEGPIRVEVRTTSAWPVGAHAVLELADGEIIPLEPDPVASVIDPDAGTRIHWFSPVQERSLPNGLRGVVRLAAAAGVWEVPAGAILQVGEGSFAVRRRAGRVERVEVEVMASSGASALVRGPLQTGDQIAADAVRVQGMGDGP